VFIVQNNDKSNCKIRLPFLKKCNFLTIIQLPKKKRVTQLPIKLTKKKVICNYNFVTSNELLPFLIKNLFQLCENFLS